MNLALAQATQALPGSFDLLPDNLLTRLLAAVVVLAAAWLLTWIVRWVLRSVGAWFTWHTVILDLVSQILTTVVWIVALAMAVASFGVDVSAIVASLGLVGFAVGFALKDVLSNVLSGMMVLYYRPFWIGDRIKVAGQEGEVDDIDLRYTSLAAEGRKVLIPNSSLFTNTVEILQQSERNERMAKQASGTTSARTEEEAKPAAKG